MQIFKYSSFLLVIAALGAGCAAAPRTATRTPGSLVTTPPRVLTPFVATPRPLPSITPAPTRQSSPALVPSPTATPLTHIVKANEDMSGIALRYRVSVEALIAANPSVNPRAMSVGSVLVIPASAQALPTVENPTPTALPVSIPQPDCWPAGDGGLWCFLLAENPLDSPIENAFVRFRLANFGGSQLVERDSAGQLNLIPPGKRMPFSVYFAAPLPEKPQVSAELIAAFPLPPQDTRYLSVQLSEVQIHIRADGRSAEVTGKISTSSGSAETVWFSAAALDESGKVVGMRRWENTQPLAEATPQTFALTVYSLGDKIASVEYLGEIRR